MNETAKAQSCHARILAGITLSSSHFSEASGDVQLNSAERNTPILEYASPLWHPTLTKSQAERLETVQCLVYSSPTPYFAILALAGIPSLQARRLDLSTRFFIKICQPTSCLHHLLPPPRDPAVTSRLRKSTLYSRPILRTKIYCSQRCADITFWYPYPIRIRYQVSVSVSVSA